MFTLVSPGGQYLTITNNVINTVVGGRGMNNNSTISRAGHGGMVAAIGFVSTVYSVLDNNKFCNIQGGQAGTVSTNK